MTIDQFDLPDAVQRRREDALRFTRPLVRDVLRTWERREWSLQGLGMLRTHLSREVRLHVWDRRFAVPDATAIHDHPWDLESLVASGGILNTRYTVLPCRGAPSPPIMTNQGVREPFVKARIVCGRGGANDSATLLARGELVWLQPNGNEVLWPGDTYRQRADEVHHTSYENGTVTLVRRTFAQDTEHAHVFFRESAGWVSAEARTAARDEVCAIVEHALLRF